MDDKEETRKIQFTGKSSYIVSLPKQWIMDLGLKKGDPGKGRKTGFIILGNFSSKISNKSNSN